MLRAQSAGLNERTARGTRLLFPSDLVCPGREEDSLCSDPRRPVSPAPGRYLTPYFLRYSPLRPPDFRTRRISPIVIARSAAFTMS
jgi:hypothetical protein